MKLLQLLTEAADKKAKNNAEAIVADDAKLESLAKSLAAHLKKQFGDKLLDTPMAVITQNARSYLDAELKLNLSKDGLEAVTTKVVSKLKSHLSESTDEDIHEAKKPADEGYPMEAYGVKGMKSTPWRKTFKTAAEFEKWVEKYDAEVQGTRSADDK